MSGEVNGVDFAQWLEKFRQTVAALRNNSTATIGEQLSSLSVSLKSGTYKKLEAKQEERLEMEVAELWETLMALPNEESAPQLAIALGTSLVRLLVFILTCSRRQNDSLWLQNGIQISLHAGKICFDHKRIPELDECLSACRSWLLQLKTLKKETQLPQESQLYLYEMLALYLRHEYSELREKLISWQMMIQNDGVQSNHLETFRETVTKMCFNIGLEAYEQEDFSSAAFWIQQAVNLGIRDVEIRTKAVILLAAAYLDWNGTQYYAQALKLLESIPTSGPMLRLRLCALTYQESVSDTKLVQTAVLYLKSLQSSDEKECYVTEVLARVRSKRAYVILLIFSEIEYLEQEAFQAYRCSFLDFHLEALINLNQGEEASRLAQRAVTWKLSCPNEAYMNIVLRLENEAVRLYNAAQIEEALNWYSILVYLAKNLEKEDRDRVMENVFICALHCMNAEQVANILSSVTETAFRQEKRVLIQCVNFHLALLQRNVEQVQAACQDLDSVLESESYDESMVLKILARFAMSSLSLSQAESTAALLRSMATLAESPRMQITFIQSLVRLHLDMVTEEQSPCTGVTFQDIIHDLEAAHTVFSIASEPNAELCDWFAKLATNIALQATSPIIRYKLYLAAFKLRRLLWKWGASTAEQDEEGESALVMAVAYGVEATKILDDDERNKDFILRTCLETVNEYLDTKVVTWAVKSEGEVDNKTVLGLYKFYIMVGLGDTKEAEEFLTTLSAVVIARKNEKGCPEPGTWELLAAIALGHIDNLVINDSGVIPTESQASALQFPPLADPVPNLTFTAKTATWDETSVAESLRFLAVKALRQAINAYTLAEDVNYKCIARNYHYLIDLLSPGSQRGMLASPELLEKLWTYCTEAVGMAQAAGIDHYPVIEVAWLIARIWNIGIALYFRAESKHQSQRWCQMAWDLTQSSPVFQTKYECKMKRFLQKFSP